MPLSVSRSLSTRLVVAVLAGLLAAGLLSSSAMAATATGQLSGVVRDPGGRPLVGAQVTLVNSSGATVASDASGSGGRYKIAVAPGRYDLAIVTPDSPVRHIARVRGVDVGPASALDVVVLLPYVTLSGVVRDLSGAPVHEGRIDLGEADANIDSTGHYSLRVYPGTYPLSITVRPDDNDTLYATVKAITVTQDRVQDLTFAVTTLAIDGRDSRQQPAAIAATSIFSPFDCNQNCPAGFNMFPGSGEATGYWHSFQHSGTVLALPGPLLVTTTPVDPNLAQVTEQAVAAPWPNPLPIVFPAAPPPSQTPPPPPMVTWIGTVRHNGAPVPGATLDVSGTPSVDTDDQGHFALQLSVGHHSMNLTAPIGTTDASDSSGPPPGTQITVADFDIGTDRAVDVDIPTADFTVHTVDQDGQPISAAIGGTSSGADNAGAPVEIFPGGQGLGWLDDSSTTDATGTGTLLIFPGSAPSTVGASSDYGNGSASPALSDQSVTVRLVPAVTVTLSGTVRDPRGPLPLVNSPWISFGGQGIGGDLFTGDELNPDGTYALTTAPGHQILTISNEPEYAEDNTSGYTATATLPQVWIITTAFDMAASKTLDLTIPDAAPARFQLVDPDGVAPAASQFDAASTHAVDLGSGVTGQVQASTYEGSQPTFEHMMFGPATVNGDIGYSDDSGNRYGFTLLLPVAPGDDNVIAASTDYDGGDLMPAVPSTPPTTVPPATSPGTTPDPGRTTPTTAKPKTGYWALGSDGHIFNFGDAPALGDATAGAVDLEPTPTGNGYWILNRNGAIQAFGDATPLGNVDMAKLANGEEPASLSATPSGKGYWVFTNHGRVLTFGDAPFLGDMSGTKLNGPVLGSVATLTGRGYYMVASDGGIFAFGDATFAGSMGGKKLNAPVQSLVPDGDGHGYWLVTSDGGIFAFDAAFRGSMGGTRLNKPVVGMVRYGDGYLMVGADGGIFNFSSSPFAGSLGDKPPASPVVAVAALP